MRCMSERKKNLPHKLLSTLGYLLQIKYYFLISHMLGSCLVLFIVSVLLADKETLDASAAKEGAAPPPNTEPPPPKTDLPPPNADPPTAADGVADGAG